MNQVNSNPSNIDANSNFRLDCPDLVREYCRLASKKHLSESDADRLSEILELAESDGWLDFWLNEADHFLAHELDLTNKESVYNFENQQAKLRGHLEDDSVEYSYSKLFEDLDQRLKISQKELQQHLRNRGFDPGSIDGVIGPRTHSALIAFQQANQLIPDGIPDAMTRGALGLS